MGWKVWIVLNENTIFCIQTRLYYSLVDIEGDRLILVTFQLQYTNFALTAILIKRAASRQICLLRRFEPILPSFPLISDTVNRSILRSRDTPIFPSNIHGWYVPHIPLIYGHSKYIIFSSVKDSFGHSERSVRVCVIWNTENCLGMVSPFH